MKTSSFACIAALVLTAGSAFAQANCNCQGHGQFVGYQSCDPCMHGNSRGNFWTRPLFPNSCCATKAYPDAGWAPPARLPVNYDWAWYANYHPQAYYGNPGGGFSSAGRIRRQRRKGCHRCVRRFAGSTVFSHERAVCRPIHHG